MSKFNKEVQKYFNKLKLALLIIGRIYARYPYIIEECSENEEIEELLET